MNRQRTMIAAFCVLALGLALSMPQDGHSASVQRVSATSLAAPPAKCCYNPCIIYRQARPCRKICCDGKPPIKTVLTVQDPCACACHVDVPVCLPSCCKGEPYVKSRCGVFCRGVVVYKWCCGYKLVVTFKKCGDIVVTSVGR